MTIRQRIVDHIARTISAGEAREANILLGLLIANFAGIDGFLDATTAQLGGFLSARYHSAATFARRLSTMRLIYTTLIMWRMLEFNPATDIRRPTVVVHATDFDVSGGRTTAHRGTGDCRTVRQRVRLLLGAPATRRFGLDVSRRERGASFGA